MRVPLHWLAEYVDLPDDATARSVAADLVRVGLEEEGFTGGEVTGPLVVGEVLEVVAEPQKNGKTINWCQVRVAPEGAGTEESPEVRGIVCGAHNFGVGDLVVVALPGAELPGGFAISARKTYGHVSDGMIASQRELGLGDDHDGIIVLSALGLTGTPGDDAIELLGLQDETLEVNVTPDRGYCFSVRGIAREVALATGASYRDPADLPVPDATPDGWPVRLEDATPVRGRDGCDRYVARVVRGIDASRPSPFWMRRRLTEAGMRPISLAVDVTNYVMLATGQPLHAFDLDKLAGPVVVRRARAGERLRTLDDVDRVLDAEDLLITDETPAGESRILAIAGVMGGASSEVSDTTTAVLVESAHFDPVTVSRSARRHKLATEASKRFERGVDPQLAPQAAELAVRLLVEYGGGTRGPITDVGEPAVADAVELRADLATRLVGVDLGRDVVVERLEAIGCTVTGDGDVLTVVPPSWRPDLTEGADLVEEVARVGGYDSIPSVLPAAPGGRGLTRGQRARRSVARALAEQGYVEVLSHPFVAPSVHDAFGLEDADDRRRALRLANPLSEEAPELRTSLLASLVETLRRNVGRGLRDVALFEVGLVTRPDGTQRVAPQPAPGQRPSDEELAAVKALVPPQPRRLAVVLTGQVEPAGWYGPGRAADWTDALAAVRTVADRLHVPVEVAADQHAPWHPGRCARVTLADGTFVGHAGELHPAVLQRLDLPARTCAAEVDLDVLVAAMPELVEAAAVSGFPAATRDVALDVPSQVPAAQVASALREGAGDLVEDLRLFDVYVGEQVPEGHRSLAYRFVLRAPDRTLTGEEATAAADAGVALAAARTGAVQRT